MSVLNKLQRFFTAFDEDIKLSKDRITIAENLNQMFAINQSLVNNPGWRGHYNSQHSVVLRIKLEEDIKLTKMEAKHFIKFKTKYDGSKAPSDKFVQSKIDNCEDVQSQKYICSKLLYYDKRFISIIQSLSKQLDALTVLSNNLRKEL